MTFCSMRNLEALDRTLDPIEKLHSAARSCSRAGAVRSISLMMFGMLLSMRVDHFGNAAESACLVELKERLPFIAETDSEFGAFKNHYSRLIQRVPDPDAATRGCSLARELQPRFEQMKEFSDRCLVDNPEFNAGNFIVGVDQALAALNTFMTQVACGSR